MMTKLEIIKTISEKAGIAQTNAKVFFDVFLRRLSEQMKPGDVYRLGDSGYFQRKKGIVKPENIQVQLPDDKFSYVEMILYSSKEVIEENLEDVHLFTIPDSYPEFLKSTSSEEDDLESHFSLSFGKPLVTEEEFDSADKGLSGMKNIALQLDALITRADIVISTLQLLDKKTSTEFYINSRQQFNNDEFNSFQTRPDQLSSENELRDSSSRNAGDNMNSAFNANLLRDAQKAEDISAMRSLPWDFGRISFDRKVEYVREETKPGTAGNIAAQTEMGNKEGLAVESEGHKTDESTKLTEEVIDEIITDEKVIDEIIKNEKEEIEKTGSYIRVRSFISEGLKDKKKPEPFTIPEFRKDIPPAKQAEDLKTGNEFIEVKAKSETYQLKKDIKKEDVKKKDIVYKYPYEKKAEMHRQDSKRRNFVPYLIFAALVIIIIGFIYVYLEYGNLFRSEPENISYNVKRPDYVKVIERKNDVAVTFPYPKPDKYSGITGVDPVVFAGMNETTQEQKDIKESSSEEIKLKTESTPEEINKPEQVKKETIETAEKEQKNKNNISKSFGSVGGNVYKYKDYYVVQVASYPTYEVAEEEAKRFNDKGYNAFIEIADIPGKGTWYRVRVGDFTSLKQAEDFATKNSIQ